MGDGDPGGEQPACGSMTSLMGECGWGCERTGLGVSRVMLCRSWSALGVWGDLQRRVDLGVGALW